MKRYRKPYKIKKKKNIFKSRFFWFSILFLIIFVGTFYFFIFSNIFQVKEIVIKNEEKVLEVEEIELIIENNLRKKILFFETKNIFLTNLNKIEKIILNQFPQLVKIEINRELPNIINVLMIERLAIAIYCQPIIIEEEKECFLIDNQGVLFKHFKNNYQLTIIQDFFSDEKLNLGNKVSKKELIDKVFEIDNRLKNDLKIQLQNISIISEQRLNAITAEGWEIYFNPKRDLNWQITQLSVVLEKKISYEKRKNLKYIDLRFDKIYIFPEGLLNPISD